MEIWLVDKYLSSRLTLPRPLVQALLNTYLGCYYYFDRVLQRGVSWAPQESAEIAPYSKELMATHYDMPLALFANFLGASMKYSMGLWEQGAGNLEQAQDAMMDDLCRKLGMADGQQVLDIGCGFGSFAAYVLTRFPNTKVYGLTLSRTQADYMRARQGEAGHPLNTDRFFLIEDDFNNVSFDQQLDRVVSIGVFEHISNLSRALKKIRSFISPEGLMLLHYIVFRPVTEHASHSRPSPFIARYVFPGGRIWSERELFKHQVHFRIEDNWIFNGSNYRRTIEAWLANLLRNLDRIRAERSLEDRVLKIWEFYLRACISTFRVYKGNYYGNSQYLLKPN